jgi:hypothetical protein
MGAKERQESPWGLNIGTFGKFLLITAPKRFGVQVSKGINSERLI